MALMECKAPNLLRGDRKEITLRFDGDDLIELPCHCRYDPALCGEDGKRVKLVRKVEIKNPDGSWSLYPSATWLDGFSSEGIISMALIKKTNGSGFNIVSSADGIPDGELLSSANEAGVYTETID